MGDMSFQYYGKTAEQIDADSLGLKKVFVHGHSDRSWTTISLPGKNLWNKLSGLRHPESTISREVLVERALQLGYSEVVLTDHADPVSKNYKTYNKQNPLEVAFEIRDYAKARGVRVVPGIELLMQPDKRKTGHHILLVNVPEGLIDTDELNSLVNCSLEDLAEYRKKGALVCLPHPLADDNMDIGAGTLFYDAVDNRFKEEIVNYVDAISVINAFQFKELNQINMAVAKKWNIALLGESDAHEPEAMGRAGTLIPKNMDFVTAVKERTTIPFGIDGQEVFAKKWANNSYSIALNYMHLLRTDPDGNHGKGFEYFKEVHQTKDTSYIRLVELLLKVSTKTVLPFVEEFVYEQRKIKAKELYQRLENPRDPDALPARHKSVLPRIVGDKFI